MSLSLGSFPFQLWCFLCLLGIEHQMLDYIERGECQPFELVGGLRLDLLDTQMLEHVSLVFSHRFLCSGLMLHI